MLASRIAARVWTMVSVFGLAGCTLVDHVAGSAVWAPERGINAVSSATGTAPLLNSEGVHVIRNHKGGRIIAVEAQRRALLDWGGPVRIEGFCNSACVILTSLPNACLSPNSKIGFHSANINFGPVGNRQIAGYLRNGVKSEFLEKWQFVPNTELFSITAQDFVRRDTETLLC